MLTDDNTYIIICLVLMTVITYVVRVAPYILFRKKIENVWVQSFIAYVPYAVLAAMAFPAILSATENLAASIAGAVVAIVLSLFSGNLMLVAIGASVAAFITGLII